MHLQTGDMLGKQESIQNTAPRYQHVPSIHWGAYTDLSTVYQELKYHAASLAGF